MPKGTQDVGNGPRPTKVLRGIPSAPKSLPLLKRCRYSREDMRRSLVIVAVGIALAASYAIGSVMAIRWALTARAPCDLPCKDLGLAIETPSTSKDGAAVYRPRCQPLRLQLELHRPQARRNTRFALWHRMKLTNDSCYKLTRVDFGDFMDTWESLEAVRSIPDDKGVVFHIWGPDGKEVPPMEFYQLGYPHTYVYGLDSTSSEWLKVERDQGAYGPDGLGPGEAIATIPTVLRPRREVPAVNIETGMHGFGTVEVAPPKDAEKPPTGFKVLDSFVLTKPGEYKIQVVFDSTVTAEAICPYGNSLPDWLGWPIVTMKDLGFNYFPDFAPLLPQNYHVHAKSAVVPFSVAP